MTQPGWPTFTPVADHALLVSFGDQITDEANAAVIALDRALAGASPPGLLECVPAFVSLLIDFDPLVTDHTAVQAHVEHLRKSTTGSRVQAQQLHEIEVCYESAFAPDLADVAKASSRSIDQVIGCHLRGDYQVRMYGFAPGYAYLSGVPPEIQVPRKAVPVRDIAAGAVLIAGPQCLVTTLIMPTGWSVIGRSPTRLLLQDQDASFLLNVGDKVRFKRIDLAAYHARSIVTRP